MLRLPRLLLSTVSMLCIIGILLLTGSEYGWMTDFDPGLEGTRIESDGTAHWSEPCFSSSGLRIQLRSFHSENERRAFAASRPVSAHTWRLRVWQRVNA